MAVTVKEPALPLVKVVEAPEVITGASFTVKVKDWVASGETPLVAVMVIGKEPLAVGVPESTPVVLFNVTPDGKVPAVLENVGAG